MSISKLRTSLTDYFSVSNCADWIFQVLNALPDQDSFYDVTDLLEEQGMEKIIRKHMNRNSTNIDLLEQFQIYEAVLQQEDGIQESPILQQIDNIRYAAVT